MLSFWEKNSLLQYDYLIIGAGIVGLSAAASLIEKNKAQKILVIERSLFPTGASTKNAGFACFGSVTELLSDLQKMSEKSVQELVVQRWNGLQKLQKRLGEKNIGLLNHGGYELIAEKETDCLQHISKVNELLEPIFQDKVFEQRDDLIKPFGFNQEKVKHLIYNRFESQIDTGAMMVSLLNYVQQKGVRVLTGCEAVQFEENREKVFVKVKNPLESKQSIVFKANKLLICTNAFTSSLLPDIDLKPGRGQVLVTKPIEQLPFKGVFHYDEGFYYFRNYGKRIIFGGGRNLDFKGEETTKIETTTQIIDHLKDQLKEVIIPQLDFEVDHQWAGIMAFGDNKQPIFKVLSPNIAIGVRLGGMGVAIGSELGDKLAGLF